MDKKKFKIGNKVVFDFGGEANIVGIITEEEYNLKAILEKFITVTSLGIKYPVRISECKFKK